MNKSEKINLKDLTFLIPVRIESEERKENLSLVLDYLESNFMTNIYVFEADKEEKFLSNKNIYKEFVKDSNSIFHRTYYLNCMTKKARTPFVAIWDTDVLAERTQIIEAIEMLRSKCVDMVFPYSGIMYKVPKIIKELFIAKNEISVLNTNKNIFQTMYGHFSVGGAFIVDRKSYVEAGMENENFYGWGAEDVERVKRWEILGYCVKMVEGPLFHLHHPRNLNSWYASNELEVKMRKELIKICAMNKYSLRSYVDLEFNIEYKY